MRSDTIAGVSPPSERLAKATPLVRLAIPQWDRWLLILAILLHALMMGSLFWGYLNSLSFASAAPKGVDFFSIWEAGHSALRNRAKH